MIAIVIKTTSVEIINKDTVPLLSLMYGFNTCFVNSLGNIS